jgi:hypothetical protein
LPTYSRNLAEPALIEEKLTLQINKVMEICI